MMMMKQREQKVYDPVIDIDDECFASSFRRAKTQFRREPLIIFI